MADLSNSKDHILIVDDKQPIRYVISQFVATMGHEVVVAGNGTLNNLDFIVGKLAENAFPLEDFNPQGGMVHGQTVLKGAVSLELGEPADIVKEGDGTGQKPVVFIHAKILGNHFRIFKDSQGVVIFEVDILSYKGVGGVKILHMDFEKVHEGFKIFLIHHSASVICSFRVSWESLGLYYHIKSLFEVKNECFERIKSLAPDKNKL